MAAEERVAAVNSQRRSGLSPAGAGTTDRHGTHASAADRHLHRRGSRTRRSRCLLVPAQVERRCVGRRPAEPGSQPSQSAQPTTPPASPPASSPPGTTGSGKSPDIYSWLPFTESGLGTAAQVTTTFANDYGTFSYQETTSAYLAPMKPLMTTALEVVVGRAFATPGVMAQRVKDQQTSTASATITSLRAYGPDSLTFVVRSGPASEGHQGPERPGRQLCDHGDRERQHLAGQ